MTENYYVTPKRLKELIKDARKNGQASNELVSVIEQIARGRVSRYARNDIEDYVQEAVLHCLTKLHKIDLRRNPFSFLTTCCWRLFLHLHRQKLTYNAKLVKLAERQRKENQ